MKFVRWGRLFTKPHDMERAGCILEAADVNGHTGLERSRRRFPYYALVLVRKGCGILEFEGKIHRLEEGDLLFVFPDHVHSYGPRSGQTWDESYLVFDGTLPKVWESVGLLDRSRPVWRLEDVSFWTSKLHRVLEATGGTGRSRLEMARLHLFLAEASAAVERVVPPVRRPYWARKAAGLLSGSLQESVSSVDVAAACGFSAVHFRRLFRAEFGESPRSFRLRKRMEEAARRMRVGRKSSRTVSAELGFCDEFYFSRCFRKYMGLTPRDFRSGLFR